MKLVFAGTRIGRDHVEKLLKEGNEVIVSTATAYGASLYQPHTRLKVYHGKMDLRDMLEFVKENKVDEIVDCTHPYAVNVTENMVKCSRILGIPYRLIERDSYIEHNGSKDITIMEDYEEACNYLLGKDGNILLTIGSNNLEYFSDLDRQRTFIRVLPTSKVLDKCERLGYTPKNIIAMEGPFSYKMNKTMYKDFNIKYIVTKDSGKSGGIDEKVQSALDISIEVIMIARKI